MFYKSKLLAASLNFLSEVLHSVLIKLSKTVGGYSVARYIIFTYLTGYNNKFIKC